MKNASIKSLLPDAFPTSKTGFYTSHLNLSSKSEKLTSRFFIGLWRSCRRSFSVKKDYWQCAQVCARYWLLTGIAVPACVSG